jgi:hypothetical protein
MYKLENLVPDVDYTPVWINTSTNLRGDAANADNGLGKYSRAPIMKILITSNDNAGTVRVWGLGNIDTDFVDVPKTAFNVGSEYEFYFKKFSGTGITMLGFTPRNYPYDL